MRRKTYRIREIVTVFVVRLLIRVTRRVDAARESNTFSHALLEYLCDLGDFFLDIFLDFAVSNTVKFHNHTVAKCNLKQVKQFQRYKSALVSYTIAKKFNRTRLLFTIDCDTTASQRFDVSRCFAFVRSPERNSHAVSVCDVPLAATRISVLLYGRSNIGMMIAWNRTHSVTSTTDWTKAATVSLGPAHV